VFRGFYFTSALQEGMVENLSSRRVASRFDLQLKGASPGRGRQGRAGGAIRLLPARPVPQGDLRRPRPGQALHQPGRGAPEIRGLLRRHRAARLRAGRLELVLHGQPPAGGERPGRPRQGEQAAGRAPTCNRAWKRWTSCRTASSSSKNTATTSRWALSFGLYQGEALERKLRDEYFAGVREVMVLPVAGALESLLAEMNANAAQLDPNAQAAPGAKPGQPYQDVFATNVGDAYNALKTYLMLADKATPSPAT
jgi:type VI secretion system protein ImpL